MTELEHVVLADWGHSVVVTVWLPPAPVALCDLDPDVWGDQA